MVYDKREYMKEYYKSNRDKINENRREYYKSNKDKKSENRKEYYLSNKDKISENVKKYKQTEKGKKVNTIKNWKFNGVVHPDFNALYEKYLNTKNCELCDVELTQDRYNTKTTRCLDHDHETGLFRNILCNSCNVKRR